MRPNGDYRPCSSGSNPDQPAPWYHKDLKGAVELMGISFKHT